MSRASLLFFLTLSLCAAPAGAFARRRPPSPADAVVDASALRGEVTDFLSAELAVHLGDIKTYNPPPEKVLGAGSSGEYTWGTFANALGAYAELTGGRTLAGRDLARENVKQFPAEVVRPDLARFEFFRRGERQAGVWLVRQGPIFFTLPITTGTKPGVADYLPAPHGLAGFASPVEQVYPALVPFIELADGRVLAAADGADEIEPSPDGKTLRAVWRRWAVVGGKAGQLEDPRVTSEVVWRLDGTTLTREETLKASEDLTLRRWWVAMPTTASRSSVLPDGGQRLDSFSSDAGTLGVSATADWPMSVSLMATGDGALGRGPRGAVPLHLVYEARDLKLAAGKAARWRITLASEGKNR